MANMPWRKARGRRLLLFLIYKKKVVSLTQKQPNTTDHAALPPLGASSTPTSSIVFLFSLDFCSMLKKRERKKKESELDGGKEGI